jgi:hypothetical protein
MRFFLSATTSLLHASFLRVPKAIKNIKTEPDSFCEQGSLLSIYVQQKTAFGKTECRLISMGFAVAKSQSKRGESCPPPSFSLFTKTG